MTDEDRRDRIEVLRATPEGRAVLAASMEAPRRCGGCDYVNGEQFYRVGGRLVPSAVYRQGVDATRVWLEGVTS